MLGKKDYVFIFKFIEKAETNKDCSIYEGEIKIVFKIKLHYKSARKI